MSEAACDDAAISRRNSDNAGSRAAARTRQSARSRQAGALDLTVFVSCYNEEEYIVDTIEAIRDALLEVGRIRYETIVMDDRSSDRSSEIVKSLYRHASWRAYILRTNKTNRRLAQNYLDAAFIGRGKYYRLVCGDNVEAEGDDDCGVRRDRAS